MPVIPYDGAHRGPCLRLVRGSSDVRIALHGGQVLGWTCRGRERLFDAPRSPIVPGGPVRGGIPVIFPQFADAGPGPRHGFARIATWTIGDHGPAHVRLDLRDDALSRAAWPRSFALEQRIALDDDALDIELVVRNTGDAPWSFTAALHTYLALVPGQRVQLDALAGRAFDDRSEGGDRSPPDGPLDTAHETERLYRDAPAHLAPAGLGVALASDGWPALMAWNPGPHKARALADLEPGDEQRFFCLEPLQIDPVPLSPGATWRARHRLVVTGD